VGRLAVLDLDGTIVDSLDDLHASVNHALGVVGLPARSRDEVHGYVGEGARVLLGRATAPHDELLEPALAAWWAHYEAHCLDRTHPYEGLPALLGGAGRILAVHTNKPGRLARKILDGLGLLSRFSAVVGGDEAPRKPDPTGVRELMARAGAANHETVFIGDSRVDVRTARAAGIPVVAVTWGFCTRAELASEGAAVLIDHVSDLAPFLA
jgi:phosphoglycolate phosphatase